MNMFYAGKEILVSAKETMESSSIHAIPNMVRNKFILVKIMWLLCFLASNGVCYWFVYKSVNDYLKYDVITNIQIDHLNKIEFPVVSICYIDNTDVLNVLNETIIYSSFNLKSCNISTDFELFNDTDQGVCFRFNSTDKYVYKKGQYNGLSLNLHIDKNYEFLKDKGLLVFISNEIIDTSALNGIKLAPGFSYDFAISKYKIKKQPKPYSNCILDLNDVNSYKSECYRKTMLKRFNKYKYSYCSDMCYQKYAGEICKFQIPEYGPVYYDDMRVIHLSNFTEKEGECLDDSWVAFANSDKYLQECDCPYECESIGFTYSTSFSSYPSQEYINSLMQDEYLANIYANDSKNQIGKNMLAINIYFDEMKETVTIHEIKVQVADLVASLGGILGLFLGFSFLSFVEIFEISLQSIIILFKQFF